MSISIPESVSLEYSDQQFVKQMLAGDERAFDAFFKEHFPRLFRFVLLRVNNDADLAEDVVQAAMCSAVAKLETWRGEASLFSWLCTFSRYELSARIKKNSRRNEIELTENAPDIRSVLDTLSESGTPETEMQRQQLQRMVHATLNGLPSKYGDVLEWKYIEGLSVNLIAERLRLSPKAAESLMTRARKLFRESFGAIGAEPPALTASLPANGGRG